MRIALLLAVALAGCVQPQDPGPGGGGGGGGYYPPPDPPPGPPGTGYGCTADSQCGTGYVCARTYECLMPSQVRTIHAIWTMQGVMANQTSCANAPDLEIDFSGSGADPWGYAPVPCVEGKFTIDKMPTRYSYILLGREGDATGGDGAQIDATTGNAMIDLPY
jgi:hypothetical protein